MVMFDDGMHGRLLVILTFAVCALLLARGAEAQLGALISPGPLNKAHASLEGVTQCVQCHERGRRVSAEKCLVCHGSVAQRIAQKFGVHRNVKDDCVTCHVEHAGADAELRPFNRARFNHTSDTRFPLDGKHADLANKCESCHKSRSFLAVKTACSACHADVHKGELGASCQTCHSTKVGFAAAAQTFDHTQTAFPLTGAHQSATCASCHKAKTFTIAKSTTCSTCHKSPHPPTMAGACSSCHVTDNWRTRKFDHSTTKFPLAGKHATVACAGCHIKSPMTSKPSASTCATCHADVHKGEFKQDCAACHTDKGFAGGTFDHAAGANFPLTEGHAKVACASCHKNVVTEVALSRVIADFRGTSAACATCHADPHVGELGTSCTTCHSATTFSLKAFTHAREPDLFSGEHTAVACEACHKPAPAVGTPGRLTMAAGRFKTTPTACGSCHRDVHLGQVGQDCASCHSVHADKFAADRFAHDRAVFHLTGAHTPLACEACHKSETATFPAGAGTTVRLRGIPTACRTCHVDPHLGQVSQSCETCHTATTFTVKDYVHKVKAPDFFVGPHLSTPCARCHKAVTARFPTGRGTAVQFKVSGACATCHADVHRGSMGTDCRGCHTVTRLKAGRASSTASPSTAFALLHGEAKR